MNIYGRSIAREGAAHVHRVGASRTRLRRERRRGEVVNIQERIYPIVQRLDTNAANLRLFYGLAI